MKKRKSKAPFLILLLILAIVVGACGWFLSSIQPISKKEESVIFTISKGDTAKSVCQNLKEEGIIKNETSSYLFIKYLKLTDVKAGDYQLDKTMSVQEIFTILCDPTAAIKDEVLVTIPEGLWAIEIAPLLAEQTGCDPQALLDLWKNKDYIKSIMPDYPFLTEEVLDDKLRYNLEGYLFPETYYFRLNSTPEMITKRLLDQTLVIYNRHQKEFDKSEFSIHEIFTLASIVQYESGMDKDNKGIAGVFVNRIQHPEFETAGYLQSNVTATYGWGDRDVNTERDENKYVDSPYNTYVIQGLPIGPVCNPGESTIEAALNPEQHNYYYFLSDSTGTIHYAKNFAEHLKNDQKY